MPPRRKPAVPSSVMISGDVGIGHNSILSDNDLIAENFRLEDMIKVAQAKLEDWAKPHKTRLKEIEDALFARLVERKADSTRTDAGTAYISTIMSTKIENREAI